MAVFKEKEKKKNKYLLSRMPHGEQTIDAYIIRPYPSKLEKMLDIHLAELLSGDPKCIDGQNGDVLDSLIDSWAKRAKDGIDKQKAYHLEKIRDLVADKDANMQNAWDWLASDEKELEKIICELDELEQEEKKYNQDMPKW